MLIVQHLQETSAIPRRVRSPIGQLTCRRSAKAGCPPGCYYGEVARHEKIASDVNDLLQKAGDDLAVCGLFALALEVGRCGSPDHLRELVEVQG